MLISVLHRTRYAYEKPARYSVETLRLTPSEHEGQRIVEWAIEAPSFDKAIRFRDGFGNTVHQIAVSGSHEEIVVEVRGIVDCRDTAGIVKGLVEVAPPRVFLRFTPQTTPSGEIVDLARAVHGRDTLERLHGLMSAIRDRIDYQAGETHSHTSAAEALNDGKGVCQDHAHVMITAARALSIPARYITGYLIGEAEAGHAWVEAWVEGLGWVSFDPANRICPTDHYVRLAAGLDATTAAPIRGAHRGGDGERLDVVVEVAQQSAQQQS
ncbi:MAG: transglutaminase family protein [Pseudomonadota bacterium]